MKQEQEQLEDKKTLPQEEDTNERQVDVGTDRKPCEYEHCDKVIIRDPAREGKWKFKYRRFCSPQCSALSRSTSKIKPEAVVAEKVCENPKCAKLMKFEDMPDSPSRWKKRHYCSVPCHQAMMNRHGEAIPRKKRGLVKKKEVEHDNTVFGDKLPPVVWRPASWGGPIPRTPSHDPQYKLPEPVMENRDAGSGEA